MAVLGANRYNVVCLLTLTIVLAPSSAGAVQEASSGIRVQNSASLDGLRGTQGIRTNPATVNGVAYVHPTQMDVGSTGGSFVAIGTSNGLGTNAGGQDCANDYDTNWSGYYDGIIAGVYFCQLFAQDNWGANTSPSFRIERDCNLGGNIRWGLYFGGSQRACIDSGSSGAQQAIVGIEVLSDNGTDRNVDVKYTSLEVNFTSGANWQSFDNNDHRLDNNYSFDRVSSSAVNTFLAPLD